MSNSSVNIWITFLLTHGNDSLSHLCPPHSVRTNLLWPGLLCLSPFFLLYTQKHKHRGSTSTSISPFHSLNKQGHFDYLSFLSITGNLPPSLPSCPPGKSAASGPHRVQPEGQERPAEGWKGEQRHFSSCFQPLNTIIYLKSALRGSQMNLKLDEVCFWHFWRYFHLCVCRCLSKKGHLWRS